MAVGVAPSDLTSCYGPPIEPVFTGWIRPTDGVAFAQGQLGVLLPVLRARDLLVAARVLNGISISQTEARGLYPPPPRDYDEARAASKKGMQAWLKMRNSIPGISKFDQIRTFNLLLDENCLDDSFRTATKHLQQLIKQSGSASERVRTWLGTQDQVFDNCGGTGQIPEPISNGSLPDKQDRAYQIASAAFYLGRWDEAERRFKDIADDTASPWRGIADYVVGRVLLRRGSVAASRQYLTQFTVRTPNPALRKAADELLQHIDAMSDPMRALATASDRAATQAHTDLIHDVKDFDYLWNVASSNNKEAQIPGKASEGDATDWVYTFERRGGTHAFDEWQKHKTTAWLLLALRQSPEGDHLEPLLAAAREVRPDSPAYYSVAFYAAAALQQRGRQGDARNILREALGTNPSAITRNLLLAAHMKTARDWREFVQDAPRLPVGETNADFFDAQQTAPVSAVNQPERGRLDEDVTHFLNQDIPLDLMTSAVMSPETPSDLRRELASTAWTRAVVLGRMDVALQLAAALGDAFPQLADDLGLVASAEDSRKPFVAKVLILRNPGLSVHARSGWGRETEYGKPSPQESIRTIDDLRENWWCVDKEHTDPKYGYMAYEEQFDEPFLFLYGTRPPRPSFLTETEYKTARKEWGEIYSLGTPANALPRAVIAWVKEHADDPLAAEALHLAVRATRYGCTDSNTHAFSQEAFKLLHARYPQSSWSKKTPLWF